MVVVGTGVSSKEGRPTDCFTHGKPPFTATQSPQTDPTTLRVGKNVTVGHMVMLHGCTVGDNSLIGIGAVILKYSFFAWLKFVIHELSPLVTLLITSRDSNHSPQPNQLGSH